jgi:hypothetical protein
LADQVAGWLTEDRALPGMEILRRAHEAGYASPTVGFVPLRQPSAFLRSHLFQGSLGKGRGELKDPHSENTAGHLAAMQSDQLRQAGYALDSPLEYIDDPVTAEDHSWPSEW